MKILGQNKRFLLFIMLSVFAQAGLANHSIKHRTLKKHTPTCSFILKNHPRMSLCPTSRWFIALSEGPVLTHTNTIQTFYVQPDIQSAYASYKNVRGAISTELFLGLQQLGLLAISNLYNERFFNQLGLAVTVSSNVRISGQLWQDANPIFNDYMYFYKIHTVRVAFKAKTFANITPFLQAYVGGSAGTGFNRSFACTFQFAQTSMSSVGIVVPPGFSAQTKSSFSYTANTGIQVPLSEHWQTGVGYEFADWGASALGRANGQTVNSGLHLNHLYTHQLQLTLSYVM